MKILLSGMTKMQANRPRRREYNTSINALYQALLAAKHKIDWRALSYDEKDLDCKYDLCILGLGTMSEFSCTYLYETLLATGRASNVLYLVNDWKANATIQCLRDNDIFRDFVLKNNTGNRLDKSKVLKDEKRIEKCREKMFDNREERLLGPFFAWGDASIIINETPFTFIYGFDPSYFYLKQWGNVECWPYSKRIKQWTYGALADYSKWHKRLNAKWPIISFNKKTFISEEKLVRHVLPSNIGSIFPKYKASGSGWWRARYCHAVLANNVIYADPSELRNDTKIWESLDRIESMKLKELEDFSNYQSNWLRRSFVLWKDTVENVDMIVRRCK